MIARRQRALAWIAMLAMALQALWPLVVQAAPRDPATGLICTTPALADPASAASTPGTGEDGPHLLKHCPLCVGSADRADFVAGRIASFEAPRELAVERPALQAVAPQASAALLLARPRAPPHSA